MKTFPRICKLLTTTVFALIFLLAPFAMHPAYSEPPSDYKSGKAVAETLWWKIGPSSFYCDCPYRRATPEEKDIRKGNLWVIGFACGYIARNPTTKERKINARALRIEFEHVVPADMLKSGFDCANLSRRECRKKSSAFNLAEGDLYNLVPVVGELNGDRLNKEYGLIPAEERKYGACDFEVTESKAEPAESIRGDLARISLYMMDKYVLDLPEPYAQLMRDWHARNPVDAAERRRNLIIAEKMGWDNPYVVNK